MLSVFLALAASVAQAPLPLQWAQFGRSGALSGVTETVDVATGKRKGEADFPYRLRFTKTLSGGAPQVRWAESAACPAVRAVIASMRNIKMPSPAPYGMPGGSMEVIVDGTGYFITAPSSDIGGKLTISSNIGSPLALWIDASFKRLAPCWTTADS